MTASWWSRSAWFVVGLATGVTIMAVVSLLVEDSGATAGDEQPPIAEGAPPEPPTETRTTRLTSSGREPGPDTTGPATDLTMTPHQGDVVVTSPGTVVAGLDISGCVHVQADDVVVRDSRIRCDGWHGIHFYEGVRGGTVERVEIDGLQRAATGVKDGNGIVVRHADIHGTADGIKVGSNAVYEENWIHDLHQTAETHNDGLQMMTGQHVVIRNNVIDHEGRTSSLMIKTDAGPIDDVLIEGNRLSGGAFTVYVVEPPEGPHGLPTNVRLVENTFVDDSKYGALRVHADVTFVDNVFADGRPVPLTSSVPDE